MKPGPTSAIARCARLRRLFAAMALGAGMGGCLCFGDIEIPEAPVEFAWLLVGGPDVISAPWATGSAGPNLRSSADLVRAQVEAEGVVEPWTMLAPDARGMLVIDDADPDSGVLVWDDWTSGGAPARVDDASDPLWVSSRHFVIRRGEDLLLLDRGAPDEFESVASEIDPLRLRTLPEHDLWVAGVGSDLVAGPLQGPIEPPGATRMELEAPAQWVAVLERAGIALVETTDGVVHVFDVIEGAPVGLSIDGVLHWPYAFAFGGADSPVEVVAPDGRVSIVSARHRWVEVSTGGMVIPATDERMTPTRGMAWPLSPFPGVEIGGSSDSVHMAVLVLRGPMY